MPRMEQTMTNYVDRYTGLYTAEAVLFFRRMEGISGSQFCDQTCTGVRLTSADRCMSGECRLVFYVPAVFPPERKNGAVRAWIRLNLSWNRRRWQKDDFGDVSEREFGFLVSYLEGGRPDCPDLSVRWVGRERDPVLAGLWNGWAVARTDVWRRAPVLFGPSMEKAKEALAGVDRKFMDLIRGLDPAEDFSCLPRAFAESGPLPDGKGSKI